MAHEHHHHDHAPHAATAIDPVCEMVVDPRTARSAEVRGKTYYFCSEGCRTKFVADPDKYLNKTPFVLPPRKPASPAAEKPPAHDHALHEHAHHDHHRHHPAPAAVPAAPATPAPAGTKYTCPCTPRS